MDYLIGNDSTQTAGEGSIIRLSVKVCFNCLPNIDGIQTQIHCYILIFFVASTIKLILPIDSYR